MVSLSDNYCAPSIQYKYDAAYLPQPNIESILQADTSLTPRYSQHDLLLANATGVLPLLRELINLERSTQPDARLESINKRQQILNRLLLASTQISGLAAELDCEGERADQIATYLDQRDTQRIRRLTILSVVLGAATTVATTLIRSVDATKVVGVSGGVISAGFGGLAAFSSNRSVEFKHERNLLTDIWYQPKQSSVYPPIVWYVLNEKLFSNIGQHSISHNIRQRWQDYVLNGASKEQQDLYFGKGGNYQADDLHNRANMLNQLQSSVRSIYQDLQSLVLMLAN
ncbi:hypothetical protein [Spirosoma flavum]|uniref:Uncharacterized protein n=1 Tax=Spirosoma flavum TaxID=2048557 RepID=A0ABW6ALI2_9BACT